MVITLFTEILTIRNGFFFICFDGKKLTTENWKTGNDRDIEIGKTLNNDENNHSENVSPLDVTQSIVDHPLISSADSTINLKNRQVPAQCCICLEKYQIGDSIVWSSNPKCPHVYHEECMHSWLSKMGEGHCPTCRQLFCEGDIELEFGVDLSNANNNTEVSTTFEGSNEIEADE